MIWRIIPNVFFAIAVILFATAGYLYFNQPDAPGAVVDEPDREFPALTVGNNEVTFKLHNPTQHTVRVVGCGFC